MSRAAVVTGVLLAVVTLVRQRSGLFLGPWATASTVAALGILAVGWPVWRHRLGGQIALAALAVFLCVRHLSIYFHVNNIWPALAIILLASITFGLSLLGILMDRFRPAS